MKASETPGSPRADEAATRRLCAIRGVSVAALALVLMAVGAAGASARDVRRLHGAFVRTLPILHAKHSASVPSSRGARAKRASAWECFGERCNLGFDQPLVISNPGSGCLFVMCTTTTYVVYWDPSEAPYPYPAGYTSGITAFFKGVAHDSGTDQNFYSVLTQYGVKYENHFGKALVDHDPYPNAPRCRSYSFTDFCVTATQIGTELTALAARHKLPPEYESLEQAERTGPRNAYLVVLPPGVATCTTYPRERLTTETEATEVFTGCDSGPYANFCAYHGEAESNIVDVLEHGARLEGWGVYAVQPWSGEKAGCDSGHHPNGISDSALDSGLVHEFAEMITDPSGSGWLNNWPGGPEENADICQDGNWATGNAEFALKMKYGTPLGTAPNGSIYNQVVNNRDYYYQQTYSNEEGGCRQRRALPPAVTKLSRAAGPSAGGTKIKVTGLNFKAPDVTGVRFGGVPAKSFTVSSASTISAVAPAAAAAGTVDVTVTTSAGTSALVEADRFTYESK